MDGVDADPLPPRFADWFASRGWAARPHQLEMVRKAREGRHTLLIAPTGGGKTLAGFLPSLIDLAERPRRNTTPGVHTLYVSPLKALATDVERNLLRPVSEMRLDIRVEARTGDTPVHKRQRQKITPPDILLTTPEQIALFCAWEGAREWFADLHTVVIDEIHALYGGKRGDLLNLGLARLQSFAPNLRRVGLSATVNEPDLLRRWLAPSERSADPVKAPAPAAIAVPISGDSHAGDRSGVEALSHVIVSARSPGNVHASAIVAPVPTWLLDLARGNDVALAPGNYRHVLDAHAVRHILKNHGDVAKETARGQRAITGADLLRVPEIVSAPDAIAFGIKGPTGLDRLAYVKTLDDGSVFYLEEVRRGRWQFAATSMRRYPATMNVDGVLSTLDPNGRADGGDALKIVRLARGVTIEPAPLADLVLGAAGAPPVIDVLLSGEHVPWSGHTARHALAEVLDAIRGAKLSLIFVNTRFQAELAFQTLWAMNDENLPIALHHGSLSVEQRRKVEGAMADGRLRAVVCTSTLDLGIDWGEVDLVIQLAAPKGSSRLVQRVGRANHRLDDASRCLLVPANRFEVLECQAAREAVAANDLDGDPERRGARDILCQHVMGVACGDPFDMQALYEEVRGCAPYADLTWEEWEDVVDVVSTGGYALRVYDKFRRILQGPDGLWRARDGYVAQRHRLNLGSIIDYPSLSIRLVGRGKRVGGMKLGEMEESYIEMLTPGDVFLFAGRLLRYEAVTHLDCFVSAAPPGAEAQVPSWGGSKFPLSTYLAKRVRQLLQDEEGWRNLPDDVQEWLQAQKRRSVVPTDDDFLVETFRRGRRHYLVCYPFDGRIAHTTLAMLATKRLERIGVEPAGYVCSDYALAIWAAKPMGGVDFDALFDPDILGEELESWLDESFMMKRTFRQCAVIAGIIERRFPGQQKSGRQVTFSTDLIYDVLRRHQPDHLLLRCARADAATGLLNIERLGAMLTRIQGRVLHRDLPRVSPFAVPLMLEIGRETVYGQSAESVLEEAEIEASLVDEAMA